MVKMRMGKENMPDAHLHLQGQVTYASPCINQRIVIEQKAGGAGIGINAA